MAIVRDRVRETTTTTGTGTLTLAGATTGFESFNTAFGVGVACFYVLLDANGVGWEAGIGQLATSTTFTRTTVQQSSNSDAAINLSAGTHVIFCGITGGLMAPFNVDAAGSVGIGTTPQSWSLSSTRVFEIGEAGSAFITGSIANSRVGTNAYFNGTNWVRITANPTALYNITTNGHLFFANASGSAGASFTPTEVARIDASGNIISQIAGGGVRVKEGSNAKMGVATLVAGIVTVNTTAVTATSRILLTAQSLGTVTVGQGLAVSARTAGTSFTITSASPTDTSVVAWIMFEPS